jgi:hypothetical protein
MFDIKKINLAEEVKNLSSLKGEERGADLKFLRNYVRAKAGNEGVRDIENELSQSGVTLPDSSKMKDLEWISAFLPTIYMLAMAKVFNWEEKDIFELGRYAPSIQVTLRFLVRYFFSPMMTFERAAQRWQKSYSFGKMEIVEFDDKKRLVLVRLYDFKKHEITCIFLRGVFTKIVEMATGSKKTAIKETKCIFRGDAYHEYRISWE